MAGPGSKVKPDFISMELEALSLLLHHWASPEIVEKKKINWKKKMHAFRSAIAAETKKGGVRKIEPELIRNEKLWVERAIKWAWAQRDPGLTLPEVKQMLQRSMVPCRNKDNLEISRPFPVSEGFLGSLAEALISEDKISALTIIKAVADRLGVSEKTVQPLPEISKRKAVTLSEHQSLLISLFLDVCSVRSDSAKWQRIRAKILNALYASECSIIFIYYLFKTVHNLDSQIFLGNAEPDVFDDLCNKLCTETQDVDYQPFVRLFSAE